MGRPKGSKNKPRNPIADSGEEERLDADNDEFGREGENRDSDADEGANDSLEFPPDEEEPPIPPPTESGEPTPNEGVIVPEEPSEAPRPEGLPISKATTEASQGEQPKREERKRRASKGSKTTKQDRIAAAMMVGPLLDKALSALANVAGSSIRSEMIPTYNTGQDGVPKGIPFDIEFSGFGGPDFFVDKITIPTKAINPSDTTGGNTNIPATPGMAIAFNLASNGKDGIEKILQWAEENEDTVRNLAALGIGLSFAFAVYKDRKAQESIKVEKIE